MTRKKSVFREYAETIIYAFIIAMVIRTFVVEPFKIPTGSMEPTLHGDPRHGDRIFVNKFIFRFKKPQRGDIVVFTTKNIPGLSKKNYIKRLVGLPGETLEIKNGDIFIDGQRVEQKVIAKNIYSNSDPRVVSLELDQRKFKLGATKFRVPENYFLIRIPSRGEFYLLSTLFYNVPPELKVGGKFIFEPEDIYQLAGTSVESELVARSGQVLAFRKDGLYRDGEKYLAEYNRDKFFIIQGQYGMADQVFTIPEGCYYVLGDNSAISKDSRYWGCVPQANVKGKAMFIWWPYKRWQWID